MKCCKCFYACFIGKGIYGNIPAIHCRRTGKTYGYKAVDEDSDDTICYKIGCSVHPQTVAKAKRDFIKKAKRELNDGNQ